MLQKGIVEKVINRYSCKIRIPKYNKVANVTGGTSTEDLATGILCALPGTDVSYVEGDVVLVAFENDELSKPVILGLLYRESLSESGISIGNVEEKLSTIQSTLDTINNSELNTFIKYSNDGGVTFSSLFNYLNLHEYSDTSGNVYCAPYYSEGEVNGTIIDKNTKYISWNILDENGINITDKINVYTKVFDSNGNIIREVTYEDKLHLIEINNSSQIEGDLYVTYRIYATKEYVDTLHVTLSTDKTLLGDTVGTHVGLCVGYSEYAPIYPSAYKWFSCSASLGNQDIQELYDLLAILEVSLTGKINKVKTDLQEEIAEDLKVILFRSSEHPVSKTEQEIQAFVPGDPFIAERATGEYSGEVKKGNILYITIKNTTSNSFGTLQVRATQDAAASASVNSEIISYNVSGEIAFDALVRFKEALRDVNHTGTETLIYGGRIETGTITAREITANNIVSSNLNSWINLNSGTFQYANAQQWVSATKGIKWDGSSLQIKVDNLKISSGNNLKDVPTTDQTLSNSQVYYITKNNESTTPSLDDPDWTTTAPTWAAGTYIWTKTVVTYADSPQHTQVTGPVRVTGNQGTPGTDGSSYTIILTNESHTFAGTDTAAIPATTTCGILAYKNATPQVITISEESISGLPTGMSCSVSGSGTTTPVITISVDSSMITRSGEVNIPLIVDSKNFTKKFSYSLSLSGEPGESSTAYMLEISAAAVNKDNYGVFSPSKITLKGKSQSGENPLSATITLTPEEVDTIWEDN